MIEFEKRCRSCAFLLVAVAFFCSVLAESGIVQTLNDRPSLEVVKGNAGGAVVYFGVLHDMEEKDNPELYNFKKSFEKAANALKDYGVQFFQVDCLKNNEVMKAECDNNRGRVIMYSQGGGTEDFELQYLFDEDHIVAHTLQFILQGDVDVCQDKMCWDRIISENKGLKDVVLSYVRGIGDKEHRYFLETAFVYGNDYKFVLTTEKTMPGAVNNGALWYYHCKQASSTEDCKVITEMEMPTTVLSVVQFVSLQNFDRIVEMQEDGTTTLDKMDVKFPINKVYIFDTQINQMARSTAEKCIGKVHSNVYFILVDIDSHDDRLAQFGLDQESEFPTLVIEPAHLVGSVPKYYEQWPLDMDFNEDNIATELNGISKTPNDYYTKIVESVNIETVTIAAFQQPENGTAVIGGCMKEMDACTAFKIAFRRVARSLTISSLEINLDIYYVDFTGKPDDAKLNGLPGFMLYVDGEKLSHKGKMDYDSILQFIRENISPKVRHLPLSGSDHIDIPQPQNDDGDSYMTEEEEVDGHTQASLVSMEDDTMSKLATEKIKKGIEDENVMSLTEMTFNKTKDENELMVTLFYLPWCVKSIMFRGMFAKVMDKVEEMKSEEDIKTSINKVNCFNWDVLCKKQEVVKYPVIKIYRNGIKPFVYTGAFDIDTLVETIELLKSPILTKLEDNKSFVKFAKGSQEGTKPSQAAVLGIFKSENDQELMTFRNVAKEMFGQYSFAYMAGSMAKQSAQVIEAGVPSFVVLKRNNPSENTVISEDFSQMKKFVEEHSVPSYDELTALNFPKYKMFGKPFIISFRRQNDTSNDKTLSRLAARIRSVFVTWMDMDKAVTRKIMQSYLNHDDHPSLVMVNHKKGKVFEYTMENDLDKLLKWTEDCLANKVTPAAVLGEKSWKPLRQGIDYLGMIRRAERARSPQIQEVENTTPEETAVENEAENGNSETEEQGSEQETTKESVRDEL